MGRLSHTVDVVVVGAGPAGLLAGITLLRSAPTSSVVLLDAGRASDARDRTAVRAGVSDLVSGEGGAGLFSDGKLCMSLAVGGSFPVALPEPVQGALLADVAREFDIEWPNARAVTTEPLGSLGPLRDTPYPVVHLGTDDLPRLVAHLRKTFESLGGRIFFKQRVSTVKGQAEEFLVLTTRGRFRASVVVLAMGKLGSDEQASIVRSLGGSTEPQPMFVGVRAEGPLRPNMQRFVKGADPKFKLLLPDGSKVKTHCVTFGGRAVRLRYRQRSVAGSHASAASDSGKLGFGVLCGIL